MYTEDDCPNLRCGRCKYFKVNADMNGVESICKRVDHKTVLFEKKTFLSYDCGQTTQIICCDFEPAHPEQADFKEWTTFDDWWKVYKPMSAYAEDYTKNPTIPFRLGREPNVHYYVPLDKYIYGTMIQDGKLQAVKKMYYVRGKGFRYEELQDGVKI